MTSGALAVVAVDSDTVAAVHDELRSHRAEILPSRDVRRGRILAYGWFPDDASARAAVLDLRSRGWAAVQRPTDDDPALFAWHNRTQPIRVADERLVVCLPWTEAQVGAAPVIEIDPGGAFGAGAHPTTHLLLDALATRLRGGETVLDVGCGSGVLAIAAARLGATAAVGIDVEPAAVAATLANAARNGLAAQVSVLAIPLEKLEGSFGVVLANIGREVLVPMARDLERLLAPGGWLGLSGISPAQVSALAAALSAIQVVATPQLDEWSAILGEKRSAPRVTPPQ